MLKLGKMTDYAILVMAGLAAAPGAICSAHELATRSHIGLPTVSKLLRLLGQRKLVRSARGVNGGYQLARSASRIAVGEQHLSPRMFAAAGHAGQFIEVGTGDAGEERATFDGVSDFHGVGG